jgi:hypothetical protein
MHRANHPGVLGTLAASRRYLVGAITVAMVASLFTVALAPAASAAAPPAPYFNGFENSGDAIAYNTVDTEPMFDVSRVPSGTDGITAASGGYFAEAAQNSYGGPLTQSTRLGGYTSTFPTGGFSTSIAIYLKMSAATGSNDLRFDWSSAITDTSGTHRRDFIFNVGTDPTTADHFVMSASNNAPGWPANPGRDPFTVSTSGWYTFKNTFVDDGTGVLADHMSVLDAGGTTLHSWTLSDPTDIIGTTVGGNRYGWLVDNDFAKLALDDVTRSGRCTSVCYVDAAAGNDANSGVSPAEAKKTIQAAINTVDANGQVRVLPGTYNESAPNSNPTTIGGTYQFGLFFPSSKPGITLMGVTSADVAITDPTATQATIHTDATNDFGYDGIFVEAANTTIQGVKIGPNASGDNKTIEVVGENFTLQDSTTAIPNGGSIYINDFSAGGTVVKSYHVLNNIFPDGTSIDISNGAGSSSALGTTNREILDNTFNLGGGDWNAVSFNGSGTDVPWFVNTVGGAVIKGNSFEGGSLQYIRARGTYDSSEFHWSSFWNDNTYDKGAVALVTESPFDVRAFTYTVNSSSCGGTTCTFSNVRRIGATIQGEVDNAASGDTVLVKAGAYNELVTVDKSIKVKGAKAGADARTRSGPESIVDGNAGSTSFYVTADGVTVDGFTVKNQTNVNQFGAGIVLGAGTSHATIVNNIVTSNMVGLFLANDNTAGQTLIQHNVFSNNNNAGSASGTGIYTDQYVAGGAVSNVLIDANTFSGQSDSGIGFSSSSAAAPDTSITIQNNTFDGNGRGLYAFNLTHSTITGNTFQNATGGMTADVRIFEGADTLSIDHNILKNGAGRAYRANNLGTGSPDPTRIHLNRNSITGYTGPASTVQNDAGPQLDATCNWWGSSSGPGAPASTVSSNVDASTWLVSSNLTTATCSSGYTFLGYQAPLPKTKLSASNSTIPVKFRLGDANGNPLSASVASALVTRVTLSGISSTPGGGTVLTSIESCPYNTTSGVFKCNLAKPRNVTIGAQWYWITTTVKIGSTYVLPTNYGGAVNPEPVTFKK